MTLKDDIDAVRDMARKLEGEGLWSDADAAERVIAAAVERSGGPTSRSAEEQAVLDECWQVPLDSWRLVHWLRPLAAAIGRWRDAVAEGVERSGGPTSRSTSVRHHAEQALLDACDAVPLLKHPDGYVMLGYGAGAVAALAEAIDRWRAAKAEWFVSYWCDRCERLSDGSHRPACPRSTAYMAEDALAVERSGGPTSPVASANLRAAAEAVAGASDHDDLAIKAGVLARLVLALFSPVEETGPGV